MSSPRRPHALRTTAPWWRGLALGALVACGGAETPAAEQCDDAVDNDGDSFVDCADQDCAGRCHETCGNGQDDDEDGLTDCFDPECSASCTEDCTNGEDDDEDGLADCADSQCTPGCAEVCNDAVDNNGDLLVDCADPTCLATCDFDGDGFVRADYPNGDDCDDASPDIHPGATELCYNDLDDDCQPATDDDDCDGDGVAAETDCNDANAATFPGAVEVCGDGEDNDCVAPGPSLEACFGDRPTSTADGSWLGELDGDQAGITVVPVGDLDEDGSAEVVVGAYGDGFLDNGAAYLTFGPHPRGYPLSEAPLKLLGTNEADWAGYAISGGVDLSGDGRPDFAIGAYYHDGGLSNTGAVYVHRGDALGQLPIDQAWAVLAPSTEYTNAGGSLAVATDLTGDDVPDLAIGAPLYGRENRDEGAVYIVAGPMGGNQDLTTFAIATLEGDQEFDNAGDTVATGDVDSDGIFDLITGAPSSDFGGLDAGGAYLASGPLAGLSALTEATAFYAGQDAGDKAGSAVAFLSDMTGDGYGDWAVGAPEADPCADGGGAVAVIFGPSTDLLDEDLMLCGSEAGARVGAALTGGGQIDGEDAPELAIGADESTLGGDAAGAVFVLFGPVLGSADVADVADITIVGAPFSFTGSFLSGGADINGDHRADLLVGAPLDNGATPAAGAAYLFTFDL